MRGKIILLIILLNIAYYPTIAIPTQSTNNAYIYYDQVETYTPQDVYYIEFQDDLNYIIMTVYYSNKYNTYTNIDIDDIYAERELTIYIDLDNNAQTGICNYNACGADLKIVYKNSISNINNLYLYYYVDGVETNATKINEWILESNPYKVKIAVSKDLLFSDSNIVRIIGITSSLIVNDRILIKPISTVLRYAVITVDGKGDDWPSNTFVATDRETFQVPFSLENFYMAVDSTNVYMRYDISNKISNSVVERNIYSINVLQYIDINYDYVYDYEVKLLTCCAYITDLRTGNTVEVHNRYQMYYKDTNIIEVAIPREAIGNISSNQPINIEIVYFQVNIQDKVNVKPIHQTYTDYTTYKLYHTIFILDTAGRVRSASPILIDYISTIPGESRYNVMYDLVSFTLKSKDSHRIKFILYDNNPITIDDRVYTVFMFEILSGDLQSINWPIVIDVPFRLDKYVSVYYMSGSGEYVPLKHYIISNGYVRVYLEYNDYINSRNKVIYIVEDKPISVNIYKINIISNAYIINNKIIINILIDYRNNLMYNDISVRVLESSSYKYTIDKSGNNYIIAVTINDDIQPYYTVIVDLSLVDLLNSIMFNDTLIFTVPAMYSMILRDLNVLYDVLDTINVNVEIANDRIIGLHDNMLIIQAGIEQINAKLVNLNSTMIKKLVDINSRLYRMQNDLNNIYVELDNIKGIIVGVRDDVAVVFTRIGAISTSLSNLTITMIEIIDNISVVSTNMGKLLATTQDTLDLMRVIKSEVGEINVITAKITEDIIELNTSIGIIRVNSMDMLDRLGDLLGNLTNVLQITRDISSNFDELNSTIETLLDETGSLNDTLREVNASIVDTVVETGNETVRRISSSIDEGVRRVLLQGEELSGRIDEQKRIVSSLFGAAYAALLVLIIVVLSLGGESQGFNRGGKPVS